MCQPTSVLEERTEEENFGILDPVAEWTTKRNLVSSATHQVLFEALCLYFTLFMYLNLGLLFSEALGVAFLFGDRGSGRQREGYMVG